MTTATNWTRRVSGCYCADGTSVELKGERHCFLSCNEPRPAVTQGQTQSICVVGREDGLRKVKWWRVTEDWNNNEGCECSILTPQLHRSSADNLSRVCMPEGLVNLFANAPWLILRSSYRCYVQDAWVSPSGSSMEMVTSDSSFDQLPLALLVPCLPNKAHSFPSSWWPSQQPCRKQLARIPSSRRANDSGRSSQ